MRKEVLVSNPIKKTDKRIQKFLNYKERIVDRLEKKGRKKGSVLVEFVVAIPVFTLILWGILNIMLYLFASSNLNEAAYEASRALAKEMRGQEGAIQIALHTDDIPRQVETVTNQNHFVLFGTGGRTTTYEYEDVVITNGMSPGKCDALDIDRNEKNYLCAYVVEYTSTSGRVLEQVVVEMKSEFYMVGNMIPGLSDIMPLNATSVAQKELPGRYDYVD